METKSGNRPDVVIIGSGPAGAVVALLLARMGVSVLLVERSTPPEWKIGEGLPPAARPLLEKFGLWGRFLEDEHLASHANRSIWGSNVPIEQHFIFNPYGSAWHLDRSRFDAMLLLEARAAGAVVERPAHVKECRRNSQGTWSFTLSSEGRSVEIETDFVVDASGKAGWFSRRQGVQRIKLDNLIGVVSMLKPKIPLLDSATLVEAETEGWWYSALAPSGKLITAFFSDADLITPKEIRAPAAWRNLVGRSPYTAERVEGYLCSLESQPQVVSASSSYLEKAAGPGWLAVGDAAGSYDPLSSQGLLMALSTGAYAAQTIRTYFNGNTQALDLYAEQLLRSYREYAKNRKAYYTVEKRWPAATFWRRRRSLESEIQSFAPALISSR